MGLESLGNKPVQTSDISTITASTKPLEIAADSSFVDIEVGAPTTGKVDITAQPMTQEPNIAQFDDDDEPSYSLGVTGSVAYGLLSGLAFAAEKKIGEKVLDHAPEVAGFAMNEILKSGAVGNAIVFGGLALCCGPSIVKATNTLPANALGAAIKVTGTALSYGVTQMLTHAAGAAVLNSAQDAGYEPVLSNGELWKEMAVGASILGASVGGAIGLALSICKAADGDYN